jgi:universal stress protein A
MSNYKHILLAYDYTSGNEKVAWKAKKLAEQYQAKLSIVHVLDTIAMPDTAYGTVINLNQPYDYPALEQQKAILMTVADELGIPSLNRWLIWGNPKQEVVELALQEQVDLIVVGSHGRHGLALLFGSTANGVLHHATCDVLSVRLQ